MKLAIFDFDGTLFPRETLPFLLSQWNHHKYSRAKMLRVYVNLIPLYLRYKLGIKSKLTSEQMKIMAVYGFNNIFTGMTEQEVHKYLLKVSRSVNILLNPLVVEEVQKTIKEGYHTVLLSGAFRMLLNIVGENLGIQTVIGTDLYFNNGKFDPYRKPQIVIGSVKMEKLFDHFNSNEVDWPGSCAYADSYSDLALMEAVGEPVAVNPDDRLKSIASEKGWRII